MSNNVSASDFTPIKADDFKPVSTPSPAPQTGGGFSASDFKPVAASDFTPVSETPTPVSTPHTLDQYIHEASGKYKVEANVLRGIGLQESGLGTGANYDPKTGLDKDGNKGHGPWQLDPASGASPEDLARAAKDPQFAADYAAKMLQKNLAATHGDLEGALAMYNAGSPTSQAGLAYAKQVMAKMQNLDPMHLGPMKVDPETSARLNYYGQHFSSALKNKKDPLVALSRTPELQPLTQLEHQKMSAWQWLMQHSSEGMGDMLGAGMRESQALMPQVLDPEEFHKAISNSDKAKQLREFNALVWHPTQQNQAKAQENFRKALNHGVKSITGIDELLRSNSELDKGVKAHVWKPLIPAATATAQTANDFIQQAMADPFTYIDLGGDTAGRMFGKAAAAQTAKAMPYVEKALRGGAGVMRGIHSIMPKAVQDAYGHLPGWIQGAESLSKDLFGVRRDLDQAGFTRDGKRIRMSIEARHDAKYVDHQNATKKVSGDADAAAAYAADHAEELTNLAPDHTPKIKSKLHEPLPADHEHTVKQYENTVEQAKAKRADYEAVREQQKTVPRTKANAAQHEAFKAVALKHKNDFNVLRDQAKDLHGKISAAEDAARAGISRSKPKMTPIAQLVDKVSDPALSAEEREQTLNSAFKAQRNASIEQDTMKLLYGNPKYFVGHSNDIKSLNMDRVSATHAWAQDRPKLIKVATNVGKRAILYNSLPHGGVNEGTLTFMAGGLHAVAEGLGAMINPVKAEHIQFLKDYGALPSHLINDFGGKKGIAKVDDAVMHFSQNVLEHMEIGWRVGLMKTLEQTLGPATSETDKLMRGWLINDKAGDYRNQNAFAHFLQGIGGQFVAFHAGIVPKAFMTTLLKNPSRIKTYLRLGEDIQNDAHMHGITDSSPIAEGAKLVSQLPALLYGEVPSYFTDVMRDYQDFMQQGTDVKEGPVDHWLKIADHYFAPAQTVHKVGEIIGGTERHDGKQSTFEEKMLDTIMLAFGKEYAQTPEAKQNAKDMKSQRYINREGN